MNQKYSYLFGVICKILVFVLVATALIFLYPSWIVIDQVQQAILEVILSLSQYVSIYVGTLMEEMVAAWRGRERCATMGTGGLESPSRSAQQTSQGVQIFQMDLNEPAPPLAFDLNEPPATEQNEPPAGPSLAPEPEEREQAPTVGLNLDPSQSSRRLDGGEQEGNS